ncbi:MAG: cell division protein FtsA [Candidatus Magasanikbacteria bacterium]|nr:cell division protein FtsA [Candidatus Magasanikbacteria bacterium]
MIFKRKQNLEIISGIDIGSSAVRVVVGQYDPDEKNKRNIQILAAVEVPSEGVHKGVITSIEECVSSVSNALEKTERTIGCPIEHLWVGISGTDIISQESKGVVAVAKTDGEIEDEDVDRAVEAARTVAAPLNYEVLHVIPMTFSVDGQTGIKDPVGMTGIRLEADTRIIYGLSSHIKNITKTVYRAGVDIDDLVLSILANGEVVTTPRQKELGVVVVNIGSSTTSLVVYEDGDVVHTAVIPVGSEHITNDVAIGLRSSIDVAERVKIYFGECEADKILKKEKINLKDCGSEVFEEVSKKYVAEIVGARVAEILEKVNEELTSVQKAGVLPAGVLFTGGGSKIGGLVEFSKDIMGLPASLGYPLDIKGAADKVKDLSFGTSIGLLKWGTMLHSTGMKSSLPLVNSSSKIVEKIQSLFKSLIP